MPEPALRPGDHVVFERSQLEALFLALQRREYRIVGPTIVDGAIIYDELNSTGDLPEGWTDEQSGGTYRLKRRDDQALFGYAVGPHSWKKFLHPPVLRLWAGQQGTDTLEYQAEPQSPPKLAFLGARSCDLHAIGIQDRVFIGGPYVDPSYQARRQHVFVVALNCGHAGGTCFCVSMGTGPRATFGFDLALTELLAPDRHVFVAQVGTEEGAAVLQEVPHRLAQREDLERVDQVLANTAQHMGRTMDTTRIKELLYANLEHPRWDEVAQRCLTCGNCTLVCPTCFCFTVEDVTDLKGEVTERVRRWDSCFTTEFTYTAGRPARQSGRSRYRQWLTHKVGTWIDQYGTSGCVGCGRCITWCPVAIDITEEVAAIRATSGEKKEKA